MKSRISGIALFALAALATPAAARAANCEVLASGQLHSNDYIAEYTGPCKQGRAEGQGEARWTMRYAPDVAPIVWRGRFVNGIYLAEADTVSARRRDSSDVLLDLGVLTGPGRSKGRLWVETRADGMLPPSACRPWLRLHVTAQGPLHDDIVAKKWLDAAYQRWQRICRASVPPQGPVRPLEVRLHEGEGWLQSPPQNSLPAGAVRALTALGTSTPPPDPNWQSYRNHAGQERAEAERQQARAAALKAELQANQQRLRDFARAVSGNRFVSLKSLQQNPFRFGDEVLLVDLRLDQARTPTEAFVRSPSSTGGRSLLQGDITQWDDASRMAAVRVLGRSPEPDTEGIVLLQLIDSRVCARRDCDDFLVMPDMRRLEDADTLDQLHLRD